MSGLGSLRHLLQEAHHARPQDLPEMAMRVAPQVGADAVVIYVVDHQQRELRPLPGGSTPAR
ncbi:serine/threonine-protein phosphatase, partial [Actinoplanes sp. NPDC048791]